MERLQQLLSMLKNDPRDSFLLYACAKEYENLGDHDKALEIFLKLKDHDPDYVGLYYHLGKLYEKMDDANNAIEVYETGINIAKKISDFHALSELNTAKTNLEMDMDE